MDGLRYIFKVKFSVVYKTKKSRGKFGMEVIIGNRDDFCVLHTLNQSYHLLVSHLLSFFIRERFDKLIPIDAL
jgi:hypothetical protein